MATEAQYDEIIAPMLAAVAERCKELGMNLVARVEWAPDECGITQVGNGDDSGVGQRLAHIAVHSHGNIDALCMAALKRFDCSNSAILHPYVHN